MRSNSWISPLATNATIDCRVRTRSAVISAKSPITPIKLDTPELLPQAEPHPRNFTPPPMAGVPVAVRQHHSRTPPADDRDRRRPVTTKSISKNVETVRNYLGLYPVVRRRCFLPSINISQRSGGLCLYCVLLTSVCCRPNPHADGDSHALGWEFRQM